MIVFKNTRRIEQSKENSVQETISDVTYVKWVSFKDLIFWSSVLTTQRKKTKEKLPVAILSAAYRKY